MFVRALCYTQHETKDTIEGSPAGNRGEQEGTLWLSVGVFGYLRGQSLH
jgi:hypothetical protein